MILIVWDFKLFFFSVIIVPDLKVELDEELNITYNYDMLIVLGKTDNIEKFWFFLF